VKSEEWKVKSEGADPSDPSIFIENIGGNRRFPTTPFHFSLLPITWISFIG
jgi:hypothetical protein